MSSPSESITDIDESGLNKKRGRAQSVEPSQPQETETIQDPETVDATVSAPKKTKRDDEDNTTSVKTIRKNMKDMTTTDKLTESTSTTTTSTVESTDDHDEKNTLAVFGGKKDDDDWGEFAEEEDDQEEKKTVEEDKPKYTFGATSGFGTKGWATSQQTTAPKPTFGGFKTTSGFGAFKSTETSTKTETVPSFGSFAKATASPFAAVAAASTNALSPSETKDQEKEDESSASFGEGAKLKVPVTQQTKVETGEEDEDTIYQTKGKLLVLDSTTGNWKERGVGTFRINMKQDEKARLVMRTDSVYRLILNILLFEGMKVFIMQDKFVRFAGFETEDSETKLVNFALKLANPTLAKQVHEQITACIPK